MVVSLAAGTATMPYVGFHFHRLGPYGVLANLMAMPIVSIWVMPAGLLALLALPFGFDAPLWELMGLWKIGRASCWGRGEISGGAGSFKKKKKKERVEGGRRRTKSNA